MTRFSYGVLCNGSVKRRKSLLGKIYSYIFLFLFSILAIGEINFIWAQCWIWQRSGKDAELAAVWYTEDDTHPPTEYIHTLSTAKGIS